MIPNITIINKEISAYMLMALVGVFVSLLFSYKLAKKSGRDETDMLIVVLFAFGGGLIGAHLLYGITNFNLIVALFKNLSEIESFKSFVSIVIYIFGGGVYYGGIIGAVITAMIYIRRKKLDSKVFGDIGAITIPLFHTFGRIGCFLSGCCYGMKWEHGITYHYSLVEAANGVPRLPVQLIEAFLNCMLFILLFVLYKKGKCKGKLMALYFIIYPVYRFILEFFRGDEYRGFLFGLSTSQLISIILFVIAVIYLLVSKNKKNEDKEIQNNQSSEAVD